MSVGRTYYGRIGRGCAPAGHRRGGLAAGQFDGGGGPARKAKGATGRSTWLVERPAVPELSALNQSLRRSTGTLNARVERSVLKGALAGCVCCTNRLGPRNRLGPTSQRHHASVAACRQIVQGGSCSQLLPQLAPCEYHAGEMHPQASGGSMQCRSIQAPPPFILGWWITQAKWASISNYHSAARS